MGGLDEAEKEVVKGIIRKLHEGVDAEQLKEEFAEVLKRITPLELSLIEQELIREGLSLEDVRKLCDLHIALFKETLEKQELSTPPGHPLTILIEEHKRILGIAEKLNEVLSGLGGAGTLAEEEVKVLEELSGELRESEKHYLREEYALFPVLERHGVTEPPAIMWSEHEQIRQRKKSIRRLIDRVDSMDPGEFKRRLNRDVIELRRLLSGHFFKENNILFPTALQLITEEEWGDIRDVFDEIGYCCFTPPESTAPISLKRKTVEKTPQGEVISLDTGALTVEELQALLNTLPVELTFIDKNDEVRFFNKPKDRVFLRTKTIIGRKVERCHPRKSVHIVNKILEAFKRGEKDLAEFWIRLGPRLLYIRYFAVRDEKGEYLGTLEVTQDVTGIRELKGEKRLPDWEK